MEISVSEAKASLTELLHRAEAGEEVIPTRRGHKVARLVPLAPSLSPNQRRALIDEIRAMAPKPAIDDVPAERSEARIFYMVMTACPHDRGRYICTDRHRQ